MASTGSVTLMFFPVGLCLEEQVVPEGKLVTQEWDWRVDAVAVGDGTLLTLENTP
jgi:5-formyltetrahydrofolate cyclo-ligase